MGFVDRDMLVRPPLEIGHDVWIGANAIVLPGVSRIGDGAVIGAGSVVTKDVEPYEIVVGNPARPIRKRFGDAQIAALEKSRWWEMDRRELAGNVEKLDALLKQSK
ncbi:CatB-related O-acetyltransferase [uncultured Alistipes sp.]|uniref:CatB-related O-acetyltransferase n=1 Tax=uncultured Alistipes sp. TaxID=538949 RepID=UPI00262F3C3B|nr:CatB-related O-acetyltransferase [uncultured Alistipes sp.]